jgi:hypothetical protein
MSMVVMEPARRGGLGWIHPRSRTMALSGARSRVQSRIAETGDRVTVTQRGLGEGDSMFASVPTWAWYAGGGLLAGLLGGALYFKLKKKKR